MAQPSQGLRERKKRRTHAAIKEAALKLFLQKGFDATTTMEIAQAADISVGTLFNYFPTKESLLGDDFDPVFIRHLQSRPMDEPPFVAFRKAMEASLAEAPDDLGFSMARAKLVRSTPALRAAATLDLQRDAGRLAELFLERYGKRVAELELRVLSSILVYAVHTAYEMCIAADGQTDILELVDRALTVAEAGSRHPLNR